MYFSAIINQNIYISSKLFDKKIKKNIISNLLTTVEGIKIGPFGLVIIVIQVFKNWGKGKLLIGSPSALFCLTYKAITFKAFRGEVFDAIVTNVTNLGFFSEAGSLQIFISKQQIPRDYKYDSNRKSFFNLFDNQVQFLNEKIIRVRVVSVRSEANPGHALGTVKGRGMGILD